MRGILKHHEPLAGYTSWHIGGPADIYYRPADTEDLADFLKTLSSDTPITFLGLGSNVLVSDSGVRGVVIHLQAFQTDPVFDGDSTVIRVEAGITAAKLAKFCAKNGLVGAEFFAGIPGTVGGALAMNAGAWGGETWSHVVRVEVIDRQGNRFFRDPKDYMVGYRSVKRCEASVAGVVGKTQEEWFTGALLQFKKGDSVLATERIKALLKERNEKQPIGVFSCGSVFKNPLPQHAGQLIEASGLKGYVVGDAMVSPKHANFILNRGKATAADIRQLITHIQGVVLKDHQIALEIEVRVVGDF